MSAVEITLKEKMLLEIGIVPKGLKNDTAGRDDGDRAKNGTAFSYYRCPICGTAYHRPFGERESRPIRRCPKCWKVVAMEPAAKAEA